MMTTKIKNSNIKDYIKILLYFLISMFSYSDPLLLNPRFLIILVLLLIEACVNLLDAWASIYTFGLKQMGKKCFDVTDYIIKLKKKGLKIDENSAIVKLLVLKKLKSEVQNGILEEISKYEFKVA